MNLLIYIFICSYLYGDYWLIYIGIFISLQRVQPKVMMSESGSYWETGYMTLIGMQKIFWNVNTCRRNNTMLLRY